MPRSAPAVFGALALAASVTASHSSFKRMSEHARAAAAPAWKRSDVTGVAYYGFQNSTMNACGTYSADSDMIIGVGPDYFGDLSTVSSKCFQHITVSLASDSSKSVDVTLTDACNDCGASGNVYLSTAAFEALNGGSLGAGTLDVTWSFASSSSSNAQPNVVAASSTVEDSTSAAVAASSTVEDSTPTAVATTSTAKEATTTAKEATTTAKEATTTTQAKATTSTKTSATTTSTKTSSTGTSSEGWKLSQKLEGSAFLDFFNYDSNAGDNGGSAQYVNGVSQGLAYTSGDQVILAVDTTESVSTRNSLRMVSKTTFNAKDMNLFIFDIAHMPAVCGTWPAVWFTGANWPYDGEIDVVEGVSLYNKNIYSIHTGSGCSIPSSAVSSMSAVTIVEATGTNCDANADPGACGFTDDSSSTFGPGFNSAGGGVFALQFDTTGIKMWFFQSGKVPSDISSLAPNPSTWGNPRMSVPTSDCSPTTFFSDLMMVVDTNLAGTFTEGVWAVDGAGGQSTSCKTQTGVDSAAQYVQNHGSEFGDAAQWKINGFYIYNQ
ncbi:concanavalin A-like lectin/glucanase domain-containing protein [Mycena epipterygia]|nr:concanavalin A-like lectin/glucanase domain-containing protein [Mycena epipterygia]